MATDGEYPGILLVIEYKDVIEDREEEEISGELTYDI